MIGKEIQAFALKNAPRFSRFLTLLVRGAILHFFTLEDSTVESNFLLDFLDLFRRNYSFRVNPSLYLLMASDK